MIYRLHLNDRYSQRPCDLGNRIALLITACIAMSANETSFCEGTGCTDEEASPQNYG